MNSTVTLATLAFAGLVTVALAAASPLVKDQMKTVVDPASAVIFAVGGEVDPANGPPAKPTPDARWKEAEVAADRLNTVAGAMLQPNEAQPGEAWGKDANGLADLARRAAAAARAKDGAALAQVANDLGDNCTACHGKYKPQS